MTIKYYEISFYTWNYINWCEVEVTIKAITMISLMKEFLKCDKPLDKELKEVWEQEKRFIEHKTMTFPNVTEKDFRH